MSIESLNPQNVQPNQNKTTKDLLLYLEKN